MVTHSSAALRSALFAMPLFQEIEEAALQRIVSRARAVRAKRGDILFHRGEEAKGLYVVVSGQVKLSFVSSSGDEKVVDIVSAGQSFGEAVVFMDGDHVVTAQALAPTLLGYVTKATVFAELEREPLLARRIIAGLARRLHRLMRDLEEQSMHSGRQRLIGYLLHQCTWHRSPDGGSEIHLPATKGVIASRLNISQETFSRFLRELIRSGCIEVRGRRVRILDANRLHALAA